MTIKRLIAVIVMINIFLNTSIINAADIENDKYIISYEITKIDDNLANLIVNTTTDIGALIFTDNAGSAAKVTKVYTEDGEQRVFNTNIMYHFSNEEFVLYVGYAVDGVDYNGEYPTIPVKYRQTNNNEDSNQDNRYTFNGNQYKVFNQTMTWNEAKAYCENLGGHLATITTLDEQAFIEELYSDSRLWIGGYRDNKNEWRWVTGEEWKYTNWDAGEPNNSDNVVSDENCVALWSAYLWNDLNSENTYEQEGFICEWENSIDSNIKAENIYNGNEVDLNFDTSFINSIKDVDSAISLLNSVVDSMSAEEKSSIKAKDQLAYLAEEVAARSATVNVDDDIVINDESISSAIDTVSSVKNNSADVLRSNELNIRSIRGKAKIKTTKADKVSINKENVTKAVDIIEASTPFGSFEFEPKAVSELTVENAGTNKIKVDFNKTDRTTKVNIKFPDISTDNFKAIVDEKGNTLVTKYNPITDELSAKISESGVFTVVENEKSFDDIKSASLEVQAAIKKLASAGVIKGTSETEFSPNSSITRAEIAALIVRILNVDAPNADGGFSDVTRENWYFGAAGSSKRENIIAGYEDNTFRGTVVIPKVQITSVLARTLKNRLGYNDVNVSQLSEFSDSSKIPNWAKNDVALAAYANMVIRRTDSSFASDIQMTRGDAAIVIEKLYDKVW